MCEKRKYLDRATAEMVLKELKGKMRRDCTLFKENRSYKCPKCGCWHLTKQK